MNRLQWTGEELADIFRAMDEKQADPVKPRGKPLKPWKGEITDEDIDAAIEAWNEDVPDAAGLLEAEVE